MAEFNATRGQRGHDIIIVGGGSAGAVLAHRLSADPQCQVLLVEGGRAYAPDRYPDVIANANRVGGDSAHDWGYEAHAGPSERRIRAIRGKVLGGSSGINAAVAIRAPAKDFEKWTSAGLSGWSPSQVLETFKRLENTPDGEERYHGGAGPFPVRTRAHGELTPSLSAFIEGAASVGFPRVSDFNGAQPHGVGPYPLNVVNGVRQNTGMVYLTSEVRQRRNLTILAETEVDRVVFDGRRAVGIVDTRGAVHRGGQVILSAGTYGSAAILMRSGIGPSSELRRHGIDVLGELPVGMSLKDHPFYYNVYALKPEARSMSPAAGALLWCPSTLAHAGDLDLHVSATHLFDPEQSPTRGAIVLAVAVVQPDSIGSVRLRSRDPNAAPLIHLNFLHEERDRQRMLEGVKLSRRIGQSAAFQRVAHSEMEPGASVVDDGALWQKITASLDAYHHPTSTIPMGPAGSTHAVVSDRGAVHGIEKLHVIDASIMPDIPTAPTNLTTIMLAEHLYRREFA
jgi:choline dehydrogenase